MRWIIVMGLAMICGQSVADTRYTFSGVAYGVSNGVYSSTMSIRGSFITGTPLPNNMSLTSVLPQVLSWSFSDGVNFYTQSNSIPLGKDPLHFEIATDAQGNVSDYLIWFSSPKSPNVIGQPINSMLLGKSISYAETAGLCSQLTGDACISFQAGTSKGLVTIANYPGSWSKAVLSPANAIPTLSEWGLLIMASLMILAAGWHLRARTDL